MPSEARTGRKFLFHFRFSCVCIVYGPLQPAGFYNFNRAETKREKEEGTEDALQRFCQKADGRSWLCQQRVINLSISGQISSERLCKAR